MAEKLHFRIMHKSVDLEIKDASVGPSVIDLKAFITTQVSLPLIPHIQPLQAAKATLHILMAPKEFWNTEVIQSNNLQNKALT